MKHKRTISVDYVEKEIDLSLLVKSIVEQLVSTTTLKEE
jgi:hypothetical protein